jgi:RHS repeat-associated protein
MLLPGYRRRLKLLQLRVNGNMTSAPGKTIAYNYDNMPKSMNGTTFVYDYSGQRVKKNSTVYIGKLYECTSGTCIKYIFAGSNRVAVKTGSTINYYHTDHLGSSSVMTDSSGIMKEEIYYYPFGKTRSNTGTLNVKHKFTGQELDDETGLYNYGARYYDPAIGRFVSADSIVPDFSDPQSLNRYSYCRNNPVIITDPSGNIFIIDDIIIAAVTYVVANAAVIAEGAAIGAAIGGASAAVTGGNVWQGMALGAVSGAVFAGVGGLIGDSITYAAVPGGVGPPTAGWAAAGNIGGAMAGGAASGASTAAMTGGNVGQGALIGMGIAGGIAALGETAMYMRRDMIEQSELNQTGANANGQSAGVHGDNFKLAGCRWPCSGSWLGGVQGEQGYFFGIPYPSGGVVDHVLENFAGPHDFFNNPIWYDKIGNLKELSGLLNGVGSVMNWVNVPLAAPLALSSMAQPYTGALMPAVSELRRKE